MFERGVIVGCLTGALGAGAEAERVEDVRESGAEVSAGGREENADESGSRPEAGPWRKIELLLSRGVIVGGREEIGRAHV